MVTAWCNTLLKPIDSEHHENKLVSKGLVKISYVVSEHSTGMKQVVLPGGVLVSLVEHIDHIVTLPLQQRQEEIK